MGAPLAYDVIVVGGGIAGVSLGYELASGGLRVCLLEMERTLAFHTTGRSAATWLGTYGNGPVRALTAASHDFLVAPPPELVDTPLTHPLGMMYVGGPGQTGLVEKLHAEVVALTPEAEIVDTAAALAANPVLRADHVEAALIEPGALDLDVAGLHNAYRKGLKAHGGEILTSAPVTAAERVGEEWRLTAGEADYRAPVVVDAAGAWADRVAALFGAAPVGIEPRRRSVFMVGAESRPTGPMTIAVDESWYVKPDAGQYLCSPSEATLQEPGDAKPDELEIARAIEAINEATTLGIRSIRTPWAGLRSFVADGSPVIGYDAHDGSGVEGLFWYAGQAGFGIQMGPAAARLGAALLRGEAVPDDIAATGFDAADVAPARLTRG
jgi:D-arginine dehydrogenase